jgi:hypothetical protein
LANKKILIVYHFNSSFLKFFLKTKAADYPSAAFVDKITSCPTPNKKAADGRGLRLCD